MLLHAHIHIHADKVDVGDIVFSGDAFNHVCGVVAEDVFAGVFFAAVGAFAVQHILDALREARVLVAVVQVQVGNDGCALGDGVAVGAFQNAVHIEAHLVIDGGHLAAVNPHGAEGDYIAAAALILRQPERLGVLPEERAGHLAIIGRGQLHLRRGWGLFCPPG